MSAHNEIERRFLVTTDAWSYKTREKEASSAMVGYTIPLEEKPSTKVFRQIYNNGHEVYWYGEKGRNLDQKILKGEGEELLKDCCDQIIEMILYEVTLDNKRIAEVSSFIYIKGIRDLSVIVSVKFDSLAEADSFQPPVWFGKEITDDPNWSNQSLCINGVPRA